MRSTLLCFVCAFQIGICYSSSTDAQDSTKLIQQWRFERSHVDEKIVAAVLPTHKATFAQSPVFDQNGLVRFGGQQYSIVDCVVDELPTASFTVEAWARIDQTTRWGCLFGYQQDNGNYERGWSLGYNNDRFEFRVADQKRIVNATASTPIKIGEWYHVVGVCDAVKKQLRLYVDGKRESTIAFQADGANYPVASDRTELVIGAYKDRDELFPLNGSIREVRLYQGVLNADTIGAHRTWDKNLAEKSLKFTVRPGVRFLTPTSAEVRWETSVPGKAAVAFGLTRKPDQIVQSKSEGHSHRALLQDLVPGKTYWYRFASTNNGKRQFSPFYQLEGAMNYSVPLVDVDGRINGIHSLVSKLRQPAGYAVVLGVDERWARSLAAETKMTVVAATDESRQLQQTRRAWYDAGIYGVRLSAQETSVVPKRIANLVITTADRVREASQFLSPSGSIVTTEKPIVETGYDWSSIGDGLYIATPKSTDALAEWGHQYGTIGNASYSGEMLEGVDKTGDLEIRWLGRPGADFGIDRNPRMPAPLAIGGRLFHQGMNRMIALDAFNGAVLWSLEIPDLRRVNIPRDSSNWCADRQYVYAAVKDRLWVIDAATGEMERTIELPVDYRAQMEFGFVAVVDGLLIATATVADGSYTGFWDKASWYDGKGDQATAKVCGRALMAFDKQTGEMVWQRPADAIVHSTIAIDQEFAYFVEVKDAKLKAEDTGQLLNKRIWPSAFVVCLNRETGKQVWQRTAPAQDHEVIVSFGIADQGQYVLQTSGKKQFHFVSYANSDGRVKWQRSVDWPEDHHGAHMQHAVAMNGRLYVQPHILDATDGTVIQSGTLGKRRGCATPIGAGNSIIYRGGSGPLSLWSLNSQEKSEFTRLRPSCWLSTIPAQGMLFSPEGGGGCSCGGWMETSIGFAPAISVESE